MRVVIESKHSYHLINHGPCNLITTGDGARRNVAPINWTMPLNDDPALIATVLEGGIYTEVLARETKAFTVNVMGEPFADQLLGCGRFHGNQVDKFAKFGLTALPGKTISAPFLAESLAHIECEIVGEHPYEGVILYVGKVRHAEAEEEVWDGKSLRVEKARTLHHLTGGHFAVTERVVTAKRPT